MNEQVKRLGPAHFLVNGKPVYVPASPRELGLNARTWRPNQQTAVAWLVAHLAKAQVVEAPTGWGKSILLLATGLLTLQEHGGHAFHLTPLTTLQQKELGEYEHLNVLRGMDNEECDIQPTITVKQARCQGGFKCPRKHVCRYFVARSMVDVSPMTSMTYAYYMTSRLYQTTLPAPTILLCDEAHNIERLVMGMVSVQIKKSHCDALGLPMPPASLDKARVWANRHRATVENTLASLEEKLALLKLREEEFSRKEREYYQTVKSTRDTIINLLRTVHDPKNWVLDYLDAKVMVFKPIFVDQYARNLLWKGAGRVVLTSATLPMHDEFARMIGLPEWTDLTLPSVFPLENRPVLLDTTNEEMNKENEGPGTPAWEAMVQKIDSIIDMWPTKKGFIHSVSYERAEYIYANSRHQYKMVPPVREGLSDLLESWQDSGRPRWMVSPAIWEGIDIGADEHNAVQIIPKVMYPSLGSPQVMARKNLDPAWMPFQTGLFLVQATGRGVRHRNDSCVTYITDKGINGWLKRHDRYVPDWWKASLWGPDGRRLYPNLKA